MEENMWTIHLDYDRPVGVQDRTFVKASVNSLEPKRVIFNPPYTIVYWKDNTKTIVRCGERDEFSEEIGLAMAITKRVVERGKFLKLLEDAYRQPKKEVKNG